MFQNKTNGTTIRKAFTMFDDDEDDDDVMFQNKTNGTIIKMELAMFDAYDVPNKASATSKNYQIYYCFPNL